MKPAIINHLKSKAYWSLFAVVALLFGGLSVVPASASTTGINIANLPVVDALNRTENPLSNGGKWSALGWAIGKEEEEKEEAGKRTGQDTVSGWTPFDASPTINGAFWNPTVLNGATTGVAAAVTMNISPSPGHHIALWLNMHGPEFTLRNGYQLKWLANGGGGSYTVTLAKWVKNEQTVLVSNPSVTIPAGTELAISEAGGRITAWKGSEGTLSSFLSASDNKYFATGYAGIEGSGSTSRSLSFRLGTFQATPVEAGYLPVRDALNRSENPLSNGGKWSPLQWSTGGSTGVDTLVGWRGISSPSVAGAYWNPETFVDIGGNNPGFTNDRMGGGDAVALTMNTKPSQEGRYIALWLDMPNPGVEKTGYQLKWAENLSGTYAVTLSKWSAGVQTVLNSSKNATIPAGTRITMADVGDGVWAWMGSGDEYDVLISHGDTTFAGGYAGIEASGTLSRSTNFQAGTLPASPEKLGGLPIPGLPVIDELRPAFINVVYEPPSSKWSKLAGAVNTGSVYNGLETGGWQSSGARQAGQTSGAYWNVSTFSDSGRGDAVSGVLTLLPGSSRYQSLFLNMPSPSISKEGYELRWTGEASGEDYKVEIARVGGSRVPVATKTHVSLSIGTTLVLSAKAGNLAAWMLGVGEDHFTPLLSASTASLGSAFTSGYVGMETGGPTSAQGRFRNYGASSLNP